MLRGKPLVKIKSEGFITLSSHENETSQNELLVQFNNYVLGCLGLFFSILKKAEQQVKFIYPHLHEVVTRIKRPHQVKSHPE